MEPQQYQQLMAAVNHVTSFLERIALAIEQVALESGSVVAASPVSEPHVTYVPLHQEGIEIWTCPLHGSRKVVPAGVSRTSGKAYESFVACATPFCKERPPRSLP